MSAEAVPIVSIDPYTPSFYYLDVISGAPAHFYIRLRSTIVLCISLDRVPQNTAPACWLPFDCIRVRHPGDMGAPASSLKQVGSWVFSDSRSAVSSATHDAGGLVIGIGCARGAWHPHRASCREPDPGAIQKPNKLGLYSVGNGLPKHIFETAVIMWRWKPSAPLSTPASTK